MSVVSSYGNSKVLRSFDNINIILDSGGGYTSPFLDVSDFSSFYATVNNSNLPLNVIFRYSVNATSDLTTSFIETRITTASVNTRDLGLLLVKTRYLRVSFSGSAFQPVTFQLVFRDNPPSIIPQNVGGYINLYVDGTYANFRTLRSSNGSITLTQNIDNVDLIVTGASVVSPYKEVSNLISPTLAGSKSCIACGNANLISGGTDNFVAGGGNCNVNTSNNAIISSLSCSVSDFRICGIISCNNTHFVTGTDNSGYNVCIACENCTVTRTIGNTAMRNVCIIGCSSCTTDSSPQSVILGATTSSITNSNSYSMIIGGSLSTITNCRNSTLFSCTNCSVNTSTNCQVNSIFCSTNSTVIDGGGSANQNMILNSIGITANNSNSCMILNSLNSTMVNSSSSVIINGNIDVSCSGRAGCVFVSSRLTGIALTATLNDSYVARFVGGYTLYSNPTNTTGVILPSGGNSWGAVSLRSKKENLKELNYNKLLSKLDKLPIYAYNYKGNEATQINIGCMADDYHEIFNYIEGDNKNKNIIETMDIIGISMGMIRGLYEIIKEQQIELIDIKNRIKNLEIYN